MSSDPGFGPTETKPSAAQLLEGGLRAHKAGRLREAEALYRAALESDPDNPDAVHLLGTICLQTGRYDLAASLIRLAIAKSRDNAVYCFNLGAALERLEQLEAAAATYRRAIELRPRLAEAHFNLGNVLRRLRRLDEAVTAYGQAVSVKPDYAEAHSNMGAALRDQGRLDAAATAHLRAIQIRADYAEAYSNLGAVLYDQGQIEEAVTAYRKAIGIKGNFAEAHVNLAAALRDQRKLDEAVTVYRQAIRLQPGLAEAHFNLGHALREQGNLHEAMVAYRQAIRIKPDLVEGYVSLGNLLRELGGLEEAAAAYRRAIELRPCSAESYSNLGVILRDQGRLDEAIAAYRQATVLKPDFAEAHKNLAMALREDGRLQESRRALEEAVRLTPSNAGYHRHLTELVAVTAGDPRLTAMERLSRDSGRLSVDDQIELHFALGGAYDGLCRHEDAFRHWAEGNGLRRRQIDYDEAATLDILDRARTIFTKEFIATRTDAGHGSSLPIFVVGMPRSGSTLISRFSASHPLVCGGGELTYFHGSLTGLKGSSAARATFPDMIRDMTRKDFGELGRRYVGALGSLARDKQHVTDKMPANFILAGLIHLALPHARIIHTVRDPVDTCLSCFSKLFATRQDHTYDLGELGRYYRRYRALMEHWHRVLPEGRILDVRYEAVVADLEVEARRILAHCGLAWDPACLDFHRTERPIARRAPCRCASRSTPLRSGAGAATNRSSAHCSQNWQHDG